jgi:PPM family protein phosphatase
VTTLRAAGSTDVGQVRPQNQDAFAVGEDIVLIADGMGGYAGGEVAAAIASEVVEAQFHDDTTSDGLKSAIEEANRRIYERGVEPGLEGMGTTLVAVAIIAASGEQRVVLANVGDSRCYRLRDGVLEQLTEDHSVAAELVRMGRIEEHEEAEHPGRHVLTRVLGTEPEVEPDLFTLDAKEADRLLLCSDGLSNELTDDEIQRLLGVGEPSDAARALVAAANAHGGIDNITAVVADVLDVPADQGPHTTAVPVVAVAAGAVEAPPAGPAAPAPRPVLTARERRRRRREDRRERRRFNKWVSLRGVLFVVAFAAVAIGAYVVLRWYGTSNYYVTLRTDHVVVVQGRQGGFLTWQPKVVFTEPYGKAQLPATVAALVALGVNQASLADAQAYVSNMHVQWCLTRHPRPKSCPDTTTTTTSTTIDTATTGGT